ncbi:MAG: ankyrin repeat domain-containing protein [Planctomycetaceae bacterium]
MSGTVYIYGVEPLHGDDVWAMFEAATVGDEPAVRRLLQHDPRLVNAQCCYQMPLHRAVAGGHAGLVALLLEQGADPGQSRYTFHSWNKLLATAQADGHHEIESLLVRAMERRFGYSARFDLLRQAIVARNIPQVEAVVREHPALLQASDPLGNSALHWSVITRQLTLLHRFVDWGVPIDARRADGHTPVLLAASGATDYWFRETRGPAHPSLRNPAVLVGSLLARGADYTLSVAAAMGDLEQVDLLLDRNPALATQLDSARVSPLSRAARAGYLHIVRRLLERGANPNLPEECAPGGRALFEACCGNHRDVAELLLQHGANPNAEVDSCECCLTIAAVYHGDLALPLQQLLREHGAWFPPYRMDAQQLKQALRERAPALGHPEFLRSVMGQCDAELLTLLLETDPTAIAQLEVGDELTQLQDPVLLDRLLASGLDPTRPDWQGNTLLDACREHPNHPLPRLFEIRQGGSPPATPVPPAENIAPSQ